MPLDLWTTIDLISSFLNIIATKLIGSIAEEDILIKAIIN